MKLRRVKPKALLVMLVKRAVLFLTILCALSLFLYLVGTFQGFMDSTQEGILRAMTTLSVLQGIGAFYGIILDVFSVFSRKDKRYWVGAFFYLLIMVSGILISLGSSFIGALQSGNA